MKVIAIFSLLCLSHVVAFVPTTSRTFNRAYRVPLSKPHCSEAESSPSSVTVSEVDGLADVLVATRRTGIVGFIYSSIAGLYTGLGGYVAHGMASEEAIEMAELPPPYIPAIFGVFLLAGVGILTSTLGNVMDEEASLGLQSGARARKEIERSRSSYFKK